MAENYRLYCLDNGGHIGLADWIEAETVDEAIEKARKLHPNARKSELWPGKALVAKSALPVSWYRSQSSARAFNRLWNGEADPVEAGKMVASISLAEYPLKR